jgi:hypothetical protein
MKVDRISKFHIAALALLSGFSLQPSALLGQGSLTPPGAPAPTMKTLAQVEPRTPIATAPFTISVPGSYYLTTNLTVSTGDALTIATSGVTLDLTGFTICSTAPSATGYGILLTNRLSDITILNGHIRGGVTNNAGAYNGPGFRYGIYSAAVAVVNTRVAGVSVSGCLDDGIYLGTDDSTVVESCTVRTVGSYGIVASTIKSSVAVDCGSDAIYGDQVSDSRGGSTGNGYGLSAITAQNCCGSSASYDGLSAYTAQNCYGFSGGSSGSGIYAYQAALSCYGYTSGSGYGLYAPTAQNCYGSSGGTGPGLSAITAHNCFGLSGSGSGLSAFTAVDCQGQSNGSGTGLYADNIAIGCRGWSSSGRGLWAYLANSCLGVGTPAVSATYKYNMP